MMVRERKRLLSWLLLLLASGLSIAVAEIGLRLIPNQQWLALVSDERNLAYRYDQALGWFPIPNGKTTYRGTRSISIENNRRGFRDSEHLINDMPRMLILGDSFVWGYDVEKPERFTEKLAALLPGWAIYNLGVSGYGTDQEYLLLQEQYSFYSPQIVFLVFCVDNDRDDNSSNIRYDGYYKPYFALSGEKLLARGSPVPQSQNHFFARHDLWARSRSLRLAAKAYFGLVNPPHVQLVDPTDAIIVSMNEFTKARGAQLVVGMTGRELRLESILDEQRIPYVDLTNSLRYLPRNGSHWTPEGHTFVSQRIHDFLRQRGDLRATTP